jgi:drug/metabolite transporter (DMT)-like permease
VNKPTIEHPSRARILMAFAALYVIWGSTYLAIRYAIETLPPFLMAGLRFVAAGGILYVWTRLRGAAPPDRGHWKAAALIGGLMLLGGNGAVVWAEQRVPSGVTALLVATVPLWMVVLSRTRPDSRVLGGLVLGFAGLALLLGPAQFAGGRRIDPAGAGVLVLGSLSWTAGSLVSRRARLPSSQLLAIAMEMLAGGTLLLAASLVSGDAAGFHPGNLSARSGLSLLYLIVLGSLVGFTAYIWLLRVVDPSRVATYAYVNPLVAVFLGWALAGEPLTPRTMLAATVIVGAVALITSRPARSARARSMPRP